MKEIVSRDLHICFWYGTIPKDLKFRDHALLIFKFRFLVKLFDFRLPC
jgi:hypothetical protein